MKKILPMSLLVLLLSCSQKEEQNTLYETMKEEQMQVNVLANSIMGYERTDFDTTEVAKQVRISLRQEFIFRLNAANPDFLKGMNTNAPLTNAIEERLPIYNQLAGQRIKKQAALEGKEK